MYFTIFNSRVDSDGQSQHTKMQLKIKDHENNGELQI